MKLLSFLCVILPSTPGSETNQTRILNTACSMSALGSLHCTPSTGRVPYCISPEVSISAPIHYLPVHCSHQITSQQNGTVPDRICTIKHGSRNPDPKFIFKNDPDPIVNFAP
jgi:hypothetical protein